MNHYGLTEEEKKTHIQKYNHALFKNSMFFLDFVWEINLKYNTVVVLEDKYEPEKNCVEFDYEELYKKYEKNYILEEEIDVFRKHLSLENIKNITKEKTFYVHIRCGKDQWNLHCIVLTPSIDESQGLYCVYLGAMDIHQEEQNKREYYRSQELFREALMIGSYFHYDLDVTRGGIILRDFEARDGTHPIKDATGMMPPVSYAHWVDKWYELYEPQFDKQEEKNIFDNDYLMQSYEKNERLLDVEVKQKSQDGSGRIEFMHIFVILLENPNDKHVHAYIIWRDISEFRSRVIENKLNLQSVNKELRRTIGHDEQFRQAVLSGAIMVYNINVTRNLIEDEFYEIIDNEKYSVLKLVGLSAPCSFDTFCERWCETKVSDNSKEIFRKMYNREYFLDAYNRGEYHLEIEFETVIGRGIPIILRNTALLVKEKESGDIIAMVNAKDITAKKEEEHKKQEALREAYDAANRANSAKSDFLARMSHDIRTPMNAIIGMTAIAKNHLDDKERVDDCLGKITVASKHLLSIINEVLDMSKIESGKIELIEEEFKLHDLIDNMLTMCKQQLNSKNHELSVSFVGIKNENVIGDTQRIQQVFMNLMSNAIKYTPNGGKIKLIVTEKPTNKHKIGCYVFVFEDNGIGISEQFQKLMFEPFERADDERVRKEQGTGLGMSIAKNIVQMMNGNIEVESRLNEGTKFTVTIFLKLQDKASSYDTLDDLPDLFDELENNDFSNRRALLAEDNDLNAEIVEEVFGMIGLYVDRVTNGKEAIERLAQVEDWYYDIVFMDIQMPIMNGYEAVKEIRALGRDYTNNVPILAMSANAFADDVHMAKACGMNGHIAKPLDFGKLESMLKKWIRNK